jgi:hypothetical protein
MNMKIFENNNMDTTNYEDLFRDYSELKGSDSGSLIIPRFRPIPTEASSDKFKNLQFDKGRESLDFELFLKSRFPSKSMFIDTHNRVSIENKLKDKFKESWIKTFERYGRNEAVNLNELLYFQKDVDLRGRHPLNGNIDEPVLVVESGNRKILYNGYHRAAIFLLLNKISINAIIMSID